MIRIGLTGSIAMGKTTTADVFRDLGVPVHDSDEAVHRLYMAGGAGAAAIATIAPAAVGPDGVDRRALAKLIAADRDLLPKIEAVIHPLVRIDREQFAQVQAAKGAQVIVFDIPLLFETNSEKDVDQVIVVSTTEIEQRRRALARPGMTPEKLSRILALQLPDAEKQRRADIIIDTSISIDDVRQQVTAILRRMTDNSAPLGSARSSLGD